MDLDIQGEIEDKAEAQFSYQQDMYDFDISNMTVEFAGFEIVGQASVKPVKVEVIDVVDQKNCGSGPQTASFPGYAKDHTETFTVTFSGKVSWTNALTGSLEIPGGITIGSSHTQSIDLTAGTTHTSTDTKHVTQPASAVTLPPCKHVRATREIWVTQVSGRVRAKVRMHGTVTYKVSIDNWPDPEYTMALDFTSSLYGDFTGISGYEIRGGFNETPAVCSPPCHPATSHACRVTVGKYLRVASASHLPTGLALAARVSLEGVPGATIGQPFAFEQNPDQLLTVAVAAVPVVHGFNEAVGKSAMRVPLLAEAGVRKLAIPVTCHVPGELLGVHDERVVVDAFLPVKLEMLPG